MSLRWKLLISVLAVSAAFSGATYFVQRVIVLPEFAASERAEAHADVARGLYALERDAENLASAASDYSAWDDTYQFIVDGNAEYKTSNLMPETYKNLRLNFMGFFNTSGAAVCAELRATGGGPVLDASGLLAVLAQPDNPLIALATPESRHSGVVITPQGTMLLGSAAITTSNQEGAPRGAVVMGRFIDAAAIDDLSKRTNVVMDLRPIGSPSAGDAPVLAHLADAASIWTDATDPQHLQSFTRIMDVFDQPALLLQTTRLRAITQRAAGAARTALAISVCGGCVLTILLWFALSRMVIEPLANLTRHAVHVGANDDLRVRLNMTSRDEVGVLAREFDRMVDQLAQTRAQAVDMAHSAGKARVAADVLHNVGNVLNSVNIAAGVLREKLEASEVETVGLAAQLLLDHAQGLGAFVTEDDRGRRLPTFLAALGSQLAADKLAMLGEVTTLSDAIEHIRGVVNAQQANRTASHVLDWVRPSQLIAQAISFSADSFSRHRIHMTRRDEFDDEVRLDRHSILQILVNLMTNAKHALTNGLADAREVEIATCRVEEDGGSWLQITVRDNGEGIAAENLPRIFEMGFSTHAGGHGIGLHSAANLAQEMGGAITAQSAGRGRGATLVLSIPLSTEQAAAPA